jgi:hypothetical protein
VREDRYGRGVKEVLDDFASDVEIECFCKVDFAERV